jgi:hypothetical protein
MAFGGFIHQERKHCENNSSKETFVRTIPIKKPLLCMSGNALEFGTVSSQKEVNNDNFPFLVATQAHEKLSLSH